MFKLFNSINSTVGKKTISKYISSLYAITSALLIIMHMSLVYCDPIEDAEKALQPFVDNGIDVVVYVSELGAQWGWVLGLAFFICSLLVTGQKKDVIRAMAIAMFIAWVICIIVENKPELVTNTFTNIRDAFFGDKTQRDIDKFNQNK